MGGARSNVTPPTRPTSQTWTWPHTPPTTTSSWWGPPRAATPSTVSTSAVETSPCLRLRPPCWKPLLGNVWRHHPTGRLLREIRQCHVPGSGGQDSRFQELWAPPWSSDRVRWMRVGGFGWIFSGLRVRGGEGCGVLLWGFEFRKVSGLCWGCDRMAKEWVWCCRLLGCVFLGKCYARFSINGAHAYNYNNKAHGKTQHLTKTLK